MSLKTLLPAFAALAILGACATATPYQAATDTSRGFSNQQIEQNRFRVGFSGNSLTDRQTVETYLLYRAAELTAQQGFDHFRVVQRSTDTDKSYIPTGFGASPYYSGFACDYRFYDPFGRSIHPARFGRRGGLYASRYGPYGAYDPFFDGYDLREITRYDASAEIIMGRGPKPNDPAFFDARDVLTNLSGQIRRPEA